MLRIPLYTSPVLLKSSQLRKVLPSIITISIKPPNEEEEEEYLKKLMQNDSRVISIVVI